MRGSAHALEFRALGPLEVRRNGEEVTLAGARETTLLAVLLVHANAVVSKDRLVDELWGDHPSQTAGTALHGLVSQLRRALEPDRLPREPGAVLVTRAPGYSLRIVPDALDSYRFEQLLAAGRGALESGEASRAASILRDALALWRGDAFAGIEDAPSVHAEAIRLEELRFQAVEERIDADLALGRDHELVPELESLVRREPLRERPRAQLMFALYRSGRQAEALDLYRETRTTFRDRLGIEPTPRLRELEQAILRQDSELALGLPRLRPRAVLRRRRRAVLAATGGALIAIGVAVVAAVALTREPTPLRGAPGSVVVVDPVRSRIVRTIEVGAGPAAIVYGHGSLWVANAEDETVSRLDPETYQVVKTIGVESPVDLAASRDAIWVAGGQDGVVSRIDSETSTVVDEIDLGRRDPARPVTVQGIAVGEGAVWAVATGRGVVRLNPSSDRVTGSVDLGAEALAVAAAHGSVWAVTADSALIRLEPRTLDETARTAVGWPLDLEAVDEGVVVLEAPAFDGDASLWLVDAATAQVVRTIQLGAGATGAADVRGPTLWAVTSDGDAKRVNARTGQIEETVAIGSQPSGVAVGASDVWVSVRAPEP